MLKKNYSDWELTVLVSGTQPRRLHTSIEICYSYKKRNNSIFFFAEQISNFSQKNFNSSLYTFRIQSLDRQNLDGSNLCCMSWNLSLLFWSILPLSLLSHKSTIVLMTLNKSPYNSLLTAFESLNPLLPLLNATCRLYLTPVDKFLLDHSLSPCLNSNSLIFTLLRYY